MPTFAVGDKVVYPMQGVAEVVGVESAELAAAATLVYRLRVVASGVTIVVPVDNAELVGMRPLASADQVREVYDLLRERDARPQERQTWNRRYRGFIEKIKTGSLHEVAEVFRDLSLLSKTKSLSFGERRMLDTARWLVVKELAAADGTSETKVVGDVDTALRAS